MKKKLMSVVVALVLSVVLAGSFACKKKEQQPVPQAPPGVEAPGAIPPEHPTVPGMGQGQMPPGHQMMPDRKVQVVVPDNVKGKWSSVKLLIEDKEAKKAQEYTVKLNSEWKIPGSNLKVIVGDFLPDFTMGVGEITSASNELNNPAVGVRVMEGDKQIFPAPGRQWGWLWSREELQSAHPFEHPKFNIMLKDPVKKG